VEACEKLVQQGMPFREAYHRVAHSVEKGEFVRPGGKTHTHTGSIGNPGHERILAIYEMKRAEFPFEKGGNVSFLQGKGSICK
jgi:argininosuccinate lyase